MLIDERCEDPIRLAVGTLCSDPFSVAMLLPRHRGAVLDARHHPHRIPFLALEEAFRDARRPGTDPVEVLRGHFAALADRYRNTLPAPERHDLRSWFLGLLAMAHTLRYWRQQPLDPRRFCDLALAEDSLQQARFSLLDGTGRKAVTAVVLEAEAMVAGVRKQYRRACSVLAEAAELLRGEQPPEWRAQMLYHQGRRPAHAVPPASPRTLGHGPRGTAQPTPPASRPSLASHSPASPRSGTFGSFSCGPRPSWCVSRRRA